MRAVVLASILVLPALASAHIQLKAPAARTTEQKSGPCGATGSKRGTNVTTYQPGETITLEWDETVDHPGHYRVAFDSDGDNDFINPLRSTDNFSFTLMEPIADKTGGKYTQQITLPTTPCENCTLQLMQVMQVNEPYNSFYWQCADIKIAGDAPDPDPDPETSGGCATGRGAGLGVALALLAFLRRR
jgi:predicted carbohydrate-binding protein with CBM5 and CBM33 domain